MKDFSILSDNDLLELFQEDETGVFREIYKRYWKKLYSSAYKRLKQTELAEEVVQDFFASLWINRHNLSTINTSLSSYLYTSVSRRIIDSYRKEMVKQAYVKSLTITEVYSRETAEQKLLLKDLQHHIDLEVDNLPEKCRNVYKLSRIEHKSHKEIASFLGISEKTVENHLSKALKKLRIGLSNFLLILFFILSISLFV